MLVQLKLCLYRVASYGTIFIWSTTPGGVSCTELMGTQTCGDRYLFYNIGIFIFKIILVQVRGAAGYTVIS
eukprot:SAG31_NODE_1360_length_8638_cov_55.988055_10_plen_71_part_00